MKSGHVGTQATEKTLRGAIQSAGFGRSSGANLGPLGASDPAGDVVAGGASVVTGAANVVAGGVQTALLFRADGSAELGAEPASTRKRHHRGIRDDARRAAEYVASRGTTPIEALHNIGRLDWRRAVAQITKGTGCTKLEAFRLWVSINESLLPYTAARLNTIDLGEGAAGSLALAHFLAASAMSDRLAMSPDHKSVDSPQVIDLKSENHGLPSEVTRGLPPKGPD